MISIITQHDTLVLRSRVLRKGVDPELCRFPTDENAATFHLGYFEGDKLVCIGTFFPEDYKDMGPNGFRLRGMLQTRTLPVRVTADNLLILH